MKIEAPVDQPDGASTDDAHTDEIELISFSHVVERSPTRSNKREVQGLTDLRHAVRQQFMLPGEMPSFEELQQWKQVDQHAAAELASGLTHEPLRLLKVIDKASPFLNLWATKADQLLATVTLSLRTMYQAGTKYEVKDLLQLKLTGAFICEMATVGNYVEQPWIEGMSGALWNTAPRMDLGPVEKISMAYQKVEWLVKTKKAFAWDVEKKKSF